MSFVSKEMKKMSNVISLLLAYSTSLMHEKVRTRNSAHIKFMALVKMNQRQFDFTYYEHLF